MAALIQAETGIEPEIGGGGRGEFTVWVGDEIVAKKRANTVATLERMAAPMLIVAADADLLAPPALMRIWAAHVKQREWTVVYEAGHAIAWEQPDVCNEKVLAFLRRHRCTRGALSAVAPVPGSDTAYGSSLVGQLVVGIRRGRRPPSEHVLIGVQRKSRPSAITLTDDFHPYGVSRSGAERAVARDQRARKRLGERDVHGVVRRQVVPECPRSAEQIDVRVPAQIEVREVGNDLLGPPGRYLARSHESPERLRDFDINQVRCVEFVTIPEEARLNSVPKGGLQQELRHR